MKDPDRVHRTDALAQIKAASGIDGDDYGPADARYLEWVRDGRPAWARPEPCAAPLDGWGDRPYCCLVEAWNAATSRCFRWRDIVVSGALDKLRATPGFEHAILPAEVSERHAREDAARAELCAAIDTLRAENERLRQELETDRAARRARRIERRRLRQEERDGENVPF